MEIKQKGLKQINGSLVVLEGVENPQYEEMVETMEAGEELTYDEFIDMTKRTGTILLVIAIASGVLGLGAILLLRGNKRPKTAGILLLLAGVFNGFMPIIIALIASVFYIIAGMMALFRKPTIV